MSIFSCSKLLMTIDSRDSRDSASKKNSILCKKVNELFVDRNVNVVTLPSNSEFNGEVWRRLGKEQALCARLAQTLSS